VVARAAAASSHSLATNSTVRVVSVISTFHYVVFGCSNARLPLQIAAAAQLRNRFLGGTEREADTRAQRPHVGVERIEQQLVATEDVSIALSRYPLAPGNHQGI